MVRIQLVLQIMIKIVIVLAQTHCTKYGYLKKNSNVFKIAITIWNHYVSKISLEALEGFDEDFNRKASTTDLPNDFGKCKKVINQLLFTDNELRDIDVRSSSFPNFFYFL